MSKPVVIRFVDGAEYGVASVEVAQRVYPTAVIVRYQDGHPLEEGALDAPLDLTRMTRARLNREAAKVGVADPEQMQNKQAVIDAITAATTPAGTGSSDGTVATSYVETVEDAE